MPIPDYILKRFQRPTPPDCCVVQGQWPVIANGDPGVARVATIGLNPGGATPYNEVTPEEAWEGQKRYFQCDVYGRYFTPLEKALKECGASYYDGSACNIDLVCWATDPRGWSKVPPGARDQLIEQDKEFLSDLLRRNPNINCLLATPVRVVDELKRSHGAYLQEERMGKDRLFYGELSGSGQKCIGWNRPTRFLSRDAIKRVAELYHSGR